METIGERIAEARKKLGLTQSEFAEKLFISQSFLSGIENNDQKATLKILRLISLEYGISAVWLTNGEGDMFSEMTTKTDMLFPIVLRKLRKERGLTQEELARLTGLSLSAIRNYENGLREPNFSAVKAFELFFGVTAAELSGDAEVSRSGKLNLLKTKIFELAEFYKVCYLDYISQGFEKDFLTTITRGRFDSLQKLIHDCELYEEYDIWRKKHYEKEALGVKEDENC